MDDGLQALAVQTTSLLKCAAVGLVFDWSAAARSLSQCNASCCLSLPRLCKHQATEWEIPESMKNGLQALATLATSLLYCTAVGVGPHSAALQQLAVHNVSCCCCDVLRLRHHTANLLQNLLKRTEQGPHQCCRAGVFLMESERLVPRCCHNTGQGCLDTQPLLSCLLACLSPTGAELWCEDLQMDERCARAPFKEQIWI